MGIRNTARLIWVLIALSSGALLTTAGCSKANDGMSQAQQQKTDRLSDIAKKSGGDWEKVPPADRDYLLKNVTYGNEQAAKMLLLAKSGKLRGTPGGAPKR